MDKILDICENLSGNNKNNQRTQLILNTIQKIIDENDNQNLKYFLINLTNLSSDCEYSENYYEDTPCISYTINFNYNQYAITLLYLMYLLNYLIILAHLSHYGGMKFKKMLNICFCE